MDNCIRIRSNLAVTPVLLIITLMINLLWSAVVGVFVIAASHVYSVPIQRKETENPRYSEKREGCHSGEFSSVSLPKCAQCLCCYTESHCNPILLIIIRAYGFFPLYSSCLMLVFFVFSLSHNFCFVDYSVCDEHFNTPSPASQPRGPIQNRIHQKHSTSL